MSMKRLTREYNELIENPLSNITAHPDPNNIFEWHAIICHNADTYQLTLIFPSDYAFKPPKVYFMDSKEFYWYNMYNKIHLNILNQDWTPCLSVEKILLSILAIITSSPYNKKDTINLLCNDKNDIIKLLCDNSKNDENIFTKTNLPFVSNIKNTNLNTIKSL